MPQQGSSLDQPVDFKNPMCTLTPKAITKIHFSFCLSLLQHGGVLGRAPFLACRRVLSLCVLLWCFPGACARREEEISLFLFFEEEIFTLITSFNLLKALSPNTATLRIKA